MKTQLGNESKIYLYADTGTTCLILTISTKKKNYFNSVQRKHDAAPTNQKKQNLKSFLLSLLMIFPNRTGLPMIVTKQDTSSNPRNGKDHRYLCNTFLLTLAYIRFT